MLFMFYNYTYIGFNNLLLYGLIMFIGIYGYSSLMDRNKYAVIIEIIRAGMALLIIFQNGDWFGLDQYLSFGSNIVAAYYLSTIVGAVYFTLFEKESQKTAELL